MIIANPKPQEQALIRLDREQLRELIQRMARLWIQREAPREMSEAIYGRSRYSTIVHLVIQYHALCRWHLMQLVYWPLRLDSRIRLYQAETKRLIDKGWLVRERIPERGDDLYRLGEWGRTLALANGKRLVDRRILLGHDLLTADFMTESLRRAHVVGGVARWESEAQARLTDQLRPDAILGLELGKARLDGFIEADTGSEELGVIAQKYDKYLDYYERGDWRERFQRDTFPITIMVTKSGWERLAGMRAALTSRMSTTHSELLFYLTTERELYQLISAPHSQGPVHEPIWWLAHEEGSREIWRL